MKQVKILVYGKHPEILDTVLRLINNNEAWSGEGYTEEEVIIEQFWQRSYDILLLGGGIDETSEKKVRALFQQARPESAIVQHFGGGSGLLKSEIEGVLAAREQTSIQVTDDPFSEN